MKKNLWRVLLAVGTAAVVLLLGIWAVSLIRQERQAIQTDGGKQLAAAAQRMDTIAIEAVLDPDGKAMQVSQQLTLTLRTEEPRQELALRTWPNAFLKPDTSPIAGNGDCCPDGFSAGSLVMAQAQVEQNGQTTDALYRYTDEEKTLLSIPLAESWQPGETLQVNLRYTVNFPHAMYRFGWWGDTFMAGHAFAVPALWQDGAYRADSWLPIGDPLSGECANYTLRLTAPKDYVCAAGGSITGVARTGDSVTYTIEAQAVRDLGLVISRDLKKVTRQSGDILLEALAADQATARRMLDTAEASLAAYSERFGVYPWPVYSVCGLPLGVSGAEYTALSMVAADQEGERLEYAVAHETAHQWWYGLVGSDCATHPWMDEALCEYSLLCYVQDRYGDRAREELRQTRIEPAMRITVAGQATPGAPLDYFETATDYAVLVYGRAAALLCAADELLGGRMNDALKHYAQQHAFGIADREDLPRAVLESTGEDIEPLMVDYLDTYLLN
ncbi:MAG: M1 family metallopeptidase [Clostridia bacterium]|nr:M1 family metallopeptidase [Clostridia bacterium]